MKIYRYLSVFLLLFISIGLSAQTCNQQLGWQELPATVNGIDVNWERIGNIALYPLPIAADTCTPAFTNDCFGLPDDHGGSLSYTFSKKVNKINFLIGGLTEGDSIGVLTDLVFPVLAPSASDSCMKTGPNGTCTTLKKTVGGGVLTVIHPDPAGFKKITFTYTGNHNKSCHVILCGSSIKDDCGGLGNELPTFSGLSSTNDFHIKEGETFTLPITATNCDSCKVKFTYDLTGLTGLPNQPVITGPDSAVKTNTNTYTWKSQCGQAQVVPYNFTVRAFGNCPQGSNSAQIRVFVDKVVPQLTNTFSSVCPNSTATYTVNARAGSTYTWSVLAGTIVTSVTGTMVVVQWAIASSGSLSFDEIDQNGCTGSSGQSVNFRALPVASAGSPATICINDSVKIGSDPLTGYTYSWSSIPGGFGSSIANPKVAPVMTTTYKVVATDATTGCANSSEVVITINPPPNVTIINPGQDSVCLGSPVQLIAVNAQTYTWRENGNPAVISTSGNLITTPLVTTTYIVEGIDNIGCKNTATHKIVVRPLPVIIADQPTVSICPSISTTLTVNSNHTGTYEWHVLNDNTLIGSNNTLVITPVTSTTYVAKTTDLNGCVGSVEIPVEVYPAPGTSGIFAPTTSICPHYQGFVFTAQDTLTNSTYKWFVKGGVIAPGQPTNKSRITINWDDAEDHTAYMKVIETSEHGCIGDTVTLPINVEFTLHPPLPIGVDTVCSLEAQAVIYSIIPLPGSNYTWTTIGGSVLSTSGMGNSNAIVSWDATAPLHKLSYREDNGPCYGLSKILNIVLKTSPSQNHIDGRDSVCSGEKQSIYDLNGFSQSRYIWSLGKATKALFARNDSTSTVEINWPLIFTTISDTITVIEVSNEGCAGKPVVMIITIAPPHSPDKINGPDYVCINPESGITSVVKTYTAHNGLPGSHYQWSVSGLGTSIDTTTGDSAVVRFSSFNASNKPSVNVLETTKESCTGMIVTKQIHFDFTTPGIQKTGTRMKDPQIIEVNWDSSYSSLGNERQYLLYKRKLHKNEPWQYLGQQKQSQYTDTSVKTRQFAYEYLYKTLNICEDTIVSKAQNTILLNGKRNETQKVVQLSWNPYKNWVGGVSEYQVWRKLEEGSDYTLYSQAQANDTAISFVNGYDGFVHYYRIRAMEANTARESWSNDVVLTFEHPIFIPNVITPNGDGSNDTWKIAGIAAYKDVSMEIFNRWGTQVYSFKGNYQNDWAGTADGKDLPNETYFYIIKLNPSAVEKGLKSELKGSVTILK